MGLTIDWDYEKRCAHLPMPNYVPDTLKRFKRTRSQRPKLQPHLHLLPNYSARAQYAEEEVDEPEVSAEEKLTFSRCWARPCIMRVMWTAPCWLS